MDLATGIQTTGAAIAGIVAVIHFVRLVQTTRPARERFVARPLSNGELVKATEEASRHAEIKAILRHVAENLKTLEIDQAKLREEVDDLRGAFRATRPAGTVS